MRNLFLIAIIVLSTNCFNESHASLARVAVMGSQPIFQPITTMAKQTSLNALALPGSIWLEDDYNIFLNPALINNYRRQVSLSSSRSSEIQGGVFYNYETFVMGVYLNREEDLSLMQPGAAFKPARNIGGISADIGPRYPMEFFLGLDWGIKGGVKIAYARRSATAPRFVTESKAELEARYLRFDAGMEFFGLEIFTGANLMGHYRDSSRLDTEQNMDQFNIGMRFTYDKWKPYLVLNQQRESVSSFKIPTSVGSKIESFGVGFAYDLHLLETLHVYTNAGYWRAYLEDTSDMTVGGYNRSDWNVWMMPLNVAPEFEITDYLTLRAGFTYDLFAFAKKKEGSPTQHVENNHSLRDGVRWRLGFTVKPLDAWSTDFGFGRAANTHAVNINAHPSEQEIFGFDPGYFMALSSTYSF